MSTTNPIPGDTPITVSQTYRGLWTPGIAKDEIAVVEYTTTDGRKFYDSQFSMAKIERMRAKHGEKLASFNLITMTEEEYMKIPATVGGADGGSQAFFA